MPPWGEFGPILNEVAAGHRERCRALVQEGVVAPGLRADWIYAERFNLRPTDIALIKEQAAKAQGLPQNAETAWHQYIRFLFQPRCFYRFNGLPGAKFVYIAENKSLPGRRLPGEGEPIGRVMSVCWFETEAADAHAGAIVVHPVSGMTTGELPLLSCTVAELAMAAGYFPVILPEATPRDVERLHEQHVLMHDILHYESECLGGLEHPWSFILSNPANIEDTFFVNSPLDKLTKMAMARYLQKLLHFSNDERDHRWKLTSAALLDAIGVALGVGVAPVAAAAAAPIAARGRGRGAVAPAPIAARGRGRGGRGVRGVR